MNACFDGLRFPRSLFVFYLSLCFTLLHTLIYPHLLSFTFSPLCFFFFSLLSAAFFSFYFPVAHSTLPWCILWYTNVSLTVLSVCLFSSTFPPLPLPVLSLRLLPLWLVHGVIAAGSSSSHLSCSACCNTIWWHQAAVKPIDSPDIPVDSMV